MDDVIFKNPQRIEMDELQDFILRSGDIGIMWEEDVQECSILPPLFLELHFASLVEERYNTAVPDRWFGYTEHEINGKKVRCVRFYYLKEHPEQFPELKDFLKLKTRTEYELERLNGPTLIYEQVLGGGFTSVYDTPQAAIEAFNYEEMHRGKISRYRVEKTDNVLKFYEYYYCSDCYIRTLMITLAV